MYIPKKAWQKYEKIIENNIITDSKNEPEYRLGEDKWMKDIYRVAILTNKDCMEVAMRYPILQFKSLYIGEEITGCVYFILDHYYLFEEMRGYVSQIRGYLPLTYKFKNELINSKLYLDMKKDSDIQDLELGISESSRKPVEIIDDGEDNETWWLSHNGKYHRFN